MQSCYSNCIFTRLLSFVYIFLFIFFFFRFSRSLSWFLPKPEILFLLVGSSSPIQKFSLFDLSPSPEINLSLTVGSVVNPEANPKQIFSFWASNRWFLMGLKLDLGFEMGSGFWLWFDYGFQLQLQFGYDGFGVRSDMGFASTWVGYGVVCVMVVVVAVVVMFNHQRWWFNDGGSYCHTRLWWRTWTFCGFKGIHGYLGEYKPGLWK